MKYPKPLVAGDKIAITALSDGVAPIQHAQLDEAISQLQAQGFMVVEGACLRHSHRHVSAPAAARAAELMQFLCDESIAAIMPPWGGEFAMEILPLLDFETLAQAQPTWLIGFSDVSTIAVALTTRLGWASVHSANLMQLLPTATDPLTTQTLARLATPTGQSFRQRAATTADTWQTLGAQDADISGRLLGGCLDTLMHLINTPYFDYQGFVNRYAKQAADGVILYLENAEQSPAAFNRALLGLKYQGAFKDLNGLVLGRSATGSVEFALAALHDIDIPVIYQADIGHVGPNLTLVNGALATFTVNQRVAEVTQYQV